MLPYRNPIAVAAHRGNSAYFPENTMASFRSAVSLDPDQIEIDLHMTKDGEIIMMHDHKVDRTTDGTGLIREKTLEEMKALDAGSFKGEQFKGEKVPTFREFLEFMKDYPEITLNVELKDYPAHSGSFAYESAFKSIRMLQEYNRMQSSTINTWSGELNETLKHVYGDDIMIHAYFPQELMGGNQKRFVLDYAYCVCLWSDASCPVMDKSKFDFVRSYGVEPWMYLYGERDIPEYYDKAIEYGTRLFTSNDPETTLNYLRSKGLHK